MIVIRLEQMLSASSGSSSTSSRSKGGSRSTSIATTSAISSTNSGRLENVSHCRIRLAYSRSSSLIAERIRSYVWYSICLQRDFVDHDIQRYVQQRLRDDKGLAKWNQDGAIRQEIETALMHGARGMYAF